MSLIKKLSESLTGPSWEQRIVKEQRSPSPYRIEDRFTVTHNEKKREGFGYKVSQFEESLPNKATLVVDNHKKVIGEKPLVPLDELIDYRNKTPQLETIVGYEKDMIVGTDLNINADDDEAKEICEDFANEIGLYDKLKNKCNTSLSTGFGLFVRVRGQKGVLKNIEEFDVTTITRVFRDVYGNVLEYEQELGDGKFEKIKNNSDLIPVIFKRNGRSAFGLSEYHPLAVSRSVGNRTSRPLVEALWSLDDVVIGTLENFAYPVEYHTFEGANDEDLEMEAEKNRQSRPGDKFFINRPHQIDRREPTQAKFDSYIGHFTDILQHGTGFPLDMLTGDFTSRASSQTADSFFMRKIRSYQKYYTKLIKVEIFEELLRSLGWDEKRIEKANVIVEFETQSTKDYTPEIVQQRGQGGFWTKEEVREYDKANGQDLFDDDKIAQDEEINQQFKQKKLDEQPNAKFDKNGEEIGDRGSDNK